MNKLVKKILSVQPTVTYEELPECFMDILQAAEDPLFFQHRGVYWPSLIHNFFYTVRTKQMRGGSTLTMQLVKNVCYGHDCRNITMSQRIQKKLTEIRVSRKLEKVISKEEIIEHYLTVVNFGNGCIGLKSAAQFYYQKNVSDLTPQECLEVVSILKDSVYREPIHYPEKNQERCRHILKSLVRFRFAQMQKIFNRTLIVDNEKKYTFLLPPGSGKNV